MVLCGLDFQGFSLGTAPAAAWKADSASLRRGDAEDLESSNPGVGSFMV